VSVFLGLVFLLLFAERETKKGKKKGGVEGQMSANLWHSFLLQKCFHRGAVLVFHFLFYLLIGFDSWLQIHRAPKYQGDFTVPHFYRLTKHLGLTLWWNWVHRFVSPELLVALFLIQSVLAFRISFNLSSPKEKYLLASLYGFVYFCSQIDDFQHHFLTFLILCLMANFDPTRLERARYVSSWPLKVSSLSLQCHLKKKILSQFTGPSSGGAVMFLLLPFFFFFPLQSLDDAEMNSRFRWSTCGLRLPSCIRHGWMALS
jgi:hypothetical protein